MKLTFCRHLLYSHTLRQPLSQPLKQEPSASDVALECFWISCSNDFQCSAEYSTSAGNFDVTLGSGKNEHRWFLPVCLEATSKLCPIPILTCCNLRSGYHSIRLCFLGLFLVLRQSRCALKRSKWAILTHMIHVHSFPMSYVVNIWIETPSLSAMTYTTA
jgi:hypothetical protein